MLSSLLRPKKGRQRVQDHSPFSSVYDQSSPAAARRARRATADWTETELEDENTEDEEGECERDAEGEAVIEDDGDENDEDGHDAPLLPIFSAAHLDALPVYNLTHAIRLIVLPRTETTLTWDQLRSPQVSQFLVKPMQQQIRTSHFSRATLYALMANCLQFQKESQANPGNAGNSRTRAMVCELLAIKLLKEYNTRELIDALSYDFFPLQGISTAGHNAELRSPRPFAARISTLEVAIRASAKHFLAHPVVVQQLEAIWAGTIVFHSAADNLHRPQPTVVRIQPKQPEESSKYLLVPGQNPGYGTTSTPRSQTSPDKMQPPRQAPAQFAMRRTVTIYDPRDASLFKLSRLRVPRYRQFFSTCSLAILLCLFLAVLGQRSSTITTLEVVFWFWSAGFMLDEVVGFNEQGFSLYIMSFWNTFDLGILLLLILYYSMRLYGIFLVDYGRHEWNSMAYDVLAVNAILLFPRLFSVLDHYRYFSQLLIAFRLMALDLMAVFVLIVIACSGFFVAFTFSFSQNEEEYDAAGVAYKIFQILMGFTPTAWALISTYNFLGKTIMVLFLFICHFLVVTILITVLTNSFMAIVSNANEEHQFVFAVNTISMVKNDALFSYVAPSNILAWFLTPLRFCLPFRAFIKMNRTVIKFTHFPLLFSIFAYEKLLLARTVFEPIDLVESFGTERKRMISFQDDRPRLFSPNARMRQDSVAGFQKDRALDEVFRLAPRGDTLRTTRKNLDRQTQNVVNSWMDHHGGMASPPQEQDRSIVDRLETRRQASRRSNIFKSRGMSREISGTRSVASDPAEFMSTGSFHDAVHELEVGLPNMSNDAPQPDEDGDDELLTNDDDEGMTLDKRSQPEDSDKENDVAEDREDYFTTPMASRFPQPPPSTSASSRKNRFPENLDLPKVSPPKRRGHNRNLSTGTILFNPIETHSSSASPPKSRPLTAKHSTANTGTHTPVTSAPHTGHRTPRHSIYTTANIKPRPILPSRTHFQSVPNFNIQQHSPKRQIRHRRSSLDMGMSELGLDNDNTAGGLLGAVPSSFATQMQMAMMKNNNKEETEGVMGRLMLARMKTLEEGFAEVIRGFKGMEARAGNLTGTGTAANSSVEGSGLRDKGKGRERERIGKRKSRASTRPNSRGSIRGGGVRFGEKEKKKGDFRIGDNARNEADKELVGSPEDIMARYITEKGSSL